LHRDDDLLGWATKPLIELDELVAGLIRRVVTSAPMVRQAIFLTLAHLNRRGDAETTAQQPDDTTFAELLRHGWAKQIVRDNLGNVPDGLLRTLDRIGPHPLPSAYSYQWLWTTFTSPDPRKANALISLSEVTDRSIQVLDALDGVLVHPEVLKRVDSVVQARELSKAIRFIQSACSTATDDVLSAGFARMRAPNALPVMLHRLLRQADRFPTPPLTGDHELRPLTTARDFVEAGRRFRNCLGTMIGDALVGRVAFAELASGSAPAICELRPLSGGLGWLLADVHVERNSIVSPDVRVAAQQKCADFGIAHVAVPDAGEWRSVRRMIRQLDPFAFAA
jgi:hypothetical protein